MKNYFDALDRLYEFRTAQHKRGHIRAAGEILGAIRQCGACGRMASPCYDGVEQYLLKRAAS